MEMDPARQMPVPAVRGYVLRPRFDVRHRGLHGAAPNVRLHDNHPFRGVPHLYLTTGVKPAARPGVLRVQGHSRPATPPEAVRPHRRATIAPLRSRAEYTSPVTSFTPRVAAVIFDMDGTLLDSLAVQLESYRLAIVESGGRDRSHDEILDAFTIGSAVMMLEALIELPVGAQAVTRYAAHLREGAAQVQPYEGITAALGALATRFRLGVFTAADTGAAEVLLAATELRAFFDVVVGGDLAGRTKPSPDGLLLACEALATHPHDTAYVGDGPSDMVVARACGALGVAAGWGHQFSADRDADVVVATPDDLVRLFVDGAA